MAVRYTGLTKINWPFYHLLFFFFVFFKFANAITFIVVYIFNTGRFEILSFNFESQFVNLSVSFFLVFLKMLLLEFYLI